MPRLLLIGLDCVPPALAFDRLAHVMPCLSELRARGAWAPLRSTVPPITVPAWTSMVSGRDPGELGLYGFRYRPQGSYQLSLVDSTHVHCERLWDVAAREGKRSSVLFVPPSFPPFALQGELVGCFLTRDVEQPYSYPERLAGELRARFGAYIPDVNVRERESAALVDELCAMTRQHFAMARHVWATRQPDLLMMVEIGPDRLHHALFRGLDPRHPRFDPQLTALGERYYAQLDRELGSLLALADEDTSVIVASDHGARPMRGCFLINQWLLEQGLLQLKAPPTAETPLSASLVDWSRTRVWAEGGYYARVFLNVRDREPEGVVAPSEADALCERVRRELTDIVGPNGERWSNRVERPRELYREMRGDAPDLIAMFDDLSIRALSQVGSSSCYSERDPRGGDDANHDMHGIFVLAGPMVSARGELPECSIHDVGVTALRLLDTHAPRDWLGEDRSQST